VTLKLSQTFAKYDYNDDTDPFLVDGILFKDVRDYQEAVTTLRGSYEFQPGVIGFIEGWVNRRDYVQPITSASTVLRDSNGFAVLGGLDLVLPLGLSGEIEIGYGKQDPISKDLSPVDGLLVNGDLIWLPTPTTKVEFLARSEIAETTLTDSLGAIDRFFELSLQHAFWRYLVLGTYASYEKADFVDDPQVDQRFKEGLTAEYYFNQYASVYGRYEHTNFISTQEDTNFVENEVKLGFSDTPLAHPRFPVSPPWPVGRGEGPRSARDSSRSGAGGRRHSLGSRHSLRAEGTSARPRSRRLRRSRGC
jgi:hypothetical protein